MKSNPLIVICGIDSHLNRIKQCVHSLKTLYSGYSKSNIDIAIATFGNTTLPPSYKLKEYADKEGFLFFDAPRQDFIPLDREFHACEVIGMITIFKHFYDIGYEEVFQVHNDQLFIRNFLFRFRTEMKDKWSFIVPYCHPKEPKLSYDDAVKIDPWQMMKKSMTCRMSQTVVIFNPKFIDALYNRYKDEKGMWKEWFIKQPMFGDLALWSISKEFLGFASKHIDPIVDKLVWFKVRGHNYDFVEHLKRHKEIHFIHGDSSVDYLWNKYDTLYKKINDNYINLLDYYRDNHTLDCYTLLDNKLFYIRIPKVAGTTIVLKGTNWRVIRRRGDGWFNKITEDEFENYFTFGFVRNPYDRIVSLWKHFTTTRSKEQRVPKCTFRAFLENDYINNNFIIKHHAGPQYEYFECNGRQFDEVDFIGRFEDFDKDWLFIADKFGLNKKLPIINRTKHKHYSTYYDDWSIGKVAELYKKDIELFNYKFQKE